MTPYDAQFFIDKFKAIPESKWCVGTLSDEGGRKCALGHCGMGHSRSRTHQSVALEGIMTAIGQAASMVNDNTGGYHQKTARARMLAALRAAKKAGL